MPTPTPTPTPYIRYIAELCGTARLFIGRTPDAEGWSRVIGWHAGTDGTPATWTRALGAGIRNVTEMRAVVPLESLPHYANNGFESR
jgi:hypothetical protein